MSENSPTVESSDSAILDLLRRVSAISVSDLAVAMGVTATAVRQRLNRLMGEGLIERQTIRHGRGRPSHQYKLTELGNRQTGANFADLAIALWQEIRAIDDKEIRRGMLQRLAKSLAAMYTDRITGKTPAEKMEQIRQLLGERQVPFAVDHSGDLPVLTALACPYPVLAEQDRTICAVEKMLFSELIDQDMRLSECRLDGANCCTFEMSAPGPSGPVVAEQPTA